MTVFRYVAALAFVALAFVALAAPAQAHVACGATITTDTKLRADLTNCPGDGLVIGADGITLDLGRRTIAGSGAGAGIRLAGHRGVRISGGTVRGFESGIVLDGADGNRVSSTTVRDSAARGVDVLGGSDGNVFDRLTSDGNTTGIAVTASSRNVIRRATLTDNYVTGALLLGAERNRVERSRVSGSVGNGVAVVAGSTDNAVLANVVEGAQAGLIIDGSDRNRLALNRVTGSGDDILVAGDGNVVAGNVADRAAGGCEDCSGYGIGVLSGDGNVVTANFARRAAADGINVAAAGTTLAFNFALRNGDLGIEAVEGVRDGGGNRAVGNGNAEQCVGVDCRGGGHGRR
jgi:hypothetical protein